MAKQTSFMTFTGRLGNAIGYQRNGQYFLRSMPEIVRQTIATRRAAKRFGAASQRGALIRHAFYGELDIRCDSRHVNRLNKVLISAGNTTDLTRFRFNQHTGIDRFFGIAPELSRDGIFQLPAQDIARYKGITTLEIKVIAVRINFVTRQVTGTDVVVMRIDPLEPFTGANIPLEVPGSGTLVVTLQVRGFHDHPSCNRQYVAADIVAVMDPLPPKRLYQRTYTRRTKTLPSRKHFLPEAPSQVLTQRE